MTEHVLETKSYQTQDLRSRKLDYLLSIYLSLPKSARKIFNIFQKMNGKYKRLFMSIFSLASWAVCHRSTVFRSLKKLREVGWVGNITRPNDTSEYFLDDSVRNINFEKLLRGMVSANKNQNATPMRHIYNNNRNSINTIGTLGPEISGSEEKTVDGYPSWLPKELRWNPFKGLGSRYRKFIESIPTPAMIEAVKDCMWFEKELRKKGERIHDPKALMISRLKKQKDLVKPC